MPDTHKLSMDEARKHLTSECQKSEKPRLWENHTNNVVARARAREKLDEEFNAWVQKFDPQEVKDLTSEFQKSEKPRLWESHRNNGVARARVIDEKLDEEFNAWVQEFDPQEVKDEAGKLNMNSPCEAMVKSKQGQLPTTNKGKEQVSPTGPRYLDRSWKKQKAKGNSAKGFTMDESNRLNKLDYINPVFLGHHPQVESL